MVDVRKTERGIAMTDQNLPRVRVTIPNVSGCKYFWVLCSKSHWTTVEHVIQHVLDLNPQFAMEYNALRSEERSKAITLQVRRNKYNAEDSHWLRFYENTEVTVSLHSDYKWVTGLGFIHVLRREGLVARAESICLPESESDEEENSRQRCSICLRTIHSLEMMRLLCEHTFHVKCITRWLDVKSNCPLCRGKTE